MDDGTIKGLFIVLGIIIFGVFVYFAYKYIKGDLGDMVDSMFGKSQGLVDEELENLGGYTKP